MVETTMQKISLWNSKFQKHGRQTTIRIYEQEVGRKNNLDPKL